MSKMEMRITNTITDSENRFMYDSLVDYNMSRLGMKRSDSHDIGVFMEDGGEIKAGITGVVVGEWLFVHILWVSEELRGQGIGTKLLLACEKEAVSKGAKHSFLDTADFQAPDFYPKHGYQVKFELKNYPKTGTRYYLAKELE